MGSEIFSRVILVVCVLFAAFMVSIFLTGKTGREYRVVEPDKNIIFKNTPLNTEYIAMQYLPEFYILNELQEIKPEKIYYEIIENNINFSIVYRLVYPTERVPAIYLNFIYTAYRKLFYGSEKDIEFIQIDISKETGIIDRVLFETSSASPKSLLQIHKPMEIVKQEDKYYMKTIKDSRYLDNLPLNETHLQLAVITWNHLFKLPNKTQSYIKISSLPIYFLDNETYKDYKTARRSTGDFKSYGNFDVFIVFFLLSIFGLMFLEISGLL